MTYSFSNLAGAVRSGQPLSLEDVLAARRWAWIDGGISPAEAEAIFELNHLNPSPTADWTDFFVEALSEFIVNREPPRGCVDEANANWLIGHIDRDGRLETHAELELLVEVLESALNAPQSLKDYALRQIEQAVTTGAGPTRRAGPIRPGVIDDSEVALLRRVLFAGGGDGALAVSRAEADMLWRLKDATLGADNSAGWKSLFVQGVANHLMAFNSYRPLDRRDAQRLEAFMDDRRVDVGGFIGRMFSSLSTREDGRRARPERSAEAHEAEVAASRAIAPDEAAWLRQHHEADKALDPLEQALLDFIAAEGAESD